MNKTHGRAALIGILIFIFLVGAFSYMEYSRHQSVLLQEKTSESEKLLYYLKNYIEDKKDQLEIIANLWRRQLSSEQEEMFQEIAEETINVFPSYRFIHFIDTNLVIRYSAPQDEAKRIGLIGKDTSQDSENIIMLERMMETHKPVISPAILREVLGVYGAHIWAPILEGPDLLGIISGDLDLSYIISEEIRKAGLSQHSIKINISDIDIFRTDERQTYPVEVTHEIIGIPWTIGVYIDDRISPSIVFLTGVLLSLLVSFSVYKMLLRNRELKQTKNELEDREENLFVTLQSIGDGMIATDTKGRITRMNPAAVKLTGWKFHEASDRRIEEVFQIFNAKTGEPAINPVQEVLKKGKIVGLANDTSLIRRDGTYLQISDSAAPIKDNQERVKGVVLVFSDVTEQYRSQQMIKASEAKYRKSEERFQRMLSLVPDMISIHDPEMNIIYSNWKGFGKVIEEKRVLNTKCYRTYRGLDNICPDCQAISVLQTKEVFQKEVELPEGMWVDLRVIPLLGQDGSVEFFMEWVRDITEAKQMEQKLIQRNQEVEHLNQHLNQEIEKAHQIHNNILPKEFPNIEGIKFAAFYQPAETLGGDFYEVIQRDNKLIIYLSDISGHGLDGSMINFFVKEAIDSFITLKPEDVTPRSILRHLERQFRRENYPGEFFICIFLAVLDLETMELTYSGAGFQDTPFVKQGNGERVKLSTKGLFINGTFPVDKENFQENTITLTPGSTIFFNTDGLTEQGEPGAFYGDRLSQVFYENSHLPPGEIAQAVVEDFKSFNNDSMQGDDDITFLILQVEPEMIRHQLELTTDFLELEDLRNKAAKILPNTEEADVLINCLYELTANAMEHGNQMDPTKKVMVDLIVSHDFIQVSVEDEGAGFNWREKIDNPFELEGLTERGRGIPLTRLLCDRLFYNDQGNKVTCVVHLSQGGGVCK